jgi:predicted metal-dependent hydrolase
MTDYKNELRTKLKMDLLPKFTDEYIDEWGSGGNNINGLHKIIDSFADELLDKHIEALLSQHSKKRELEARVDELKRVQDRWGGVRSANKQSWIDDRINQLTNGEGKHE